MVKSPCTKICKMTIDNKLCMGCGRTMEEIINWGYLNNEKKEKIIQKIRARSLLKKSFKK